MTILDSCLLFGSPCIYYVILVPQRVHIVLKYIFQKSAIDWNPATTYWPKRQSAWFSDYRRIDLWTLV